MTQVLANSTTPNAAEGAQSGGLACVGCPVVTPIRCIDAPGPLAFWHLASIDAPTVAVVWALAFAWAARVALPAWTPILLALVAWAVYIADRLLDFRSALRTAQVHRLRQRHHFHWKYRRYFIPLGLASTCAAAWIVAICMPVAVRERNSILAAAGLAYFSGVHAGRTFPGIVSRIFAPLLAKETLVAVIFTSACALPTLSRVAVRAPSGSALALWPLAIATGFFILLAWLNCHSIELWESGQSSRQGSLAEGSGTFTQAIGLGLFGLVIAAGLLFNHRIALLVASGTTAALLLALLDRLRDRLSPLALRVAADLVLLTPLPFLLR